ncbi:MAG: YciI family protein [Flavobacteriales bacterium]|jgi:hypothetical protein|nr:hypothetical protein [Flavobacteriales bacterium]MCI1754067.1 YciI family protein [Flavobacteriales bacterium]
MKQFMMIFLGADYSTVGQSPEQMQERMGKWFAWGDKMAKAGVLRSGDALDKAVRRVSGPKRTVTDRAGSEIKELIGGYYVVAAKDMDAVVEIAQDYPDYDLNGTVEIREVMVFDK